MKYLALCLAPLNTWQFLPVILGQLRSISIEQGGDETQEVADGMQEAWTSRGRATGERERDPWIGDS